MVRLGHWAGDPQCPGRPVNVIELEDEVQEFEPNQDAGTRQILSVQVDVSDVRFLRPSTRLVLAVNSLDVGRREGARGVIDTAAQYKVAGRAWDRAYRRICAERGIGHLINVTPESEVYRFGNGGLLTSTERVTIPVVLADHLFCCPTALWKALCYPCSLGETLLKVLVWTSEVAAKPWNTIVDHSHWKIRLLDITV